MEHTSNYNLSQWAGEDRILREDFNADNAKIDAALELLSADKVYFGSWTGDGTANRANVSIATPNSP